MTPRETALLAALKVAYDRISIGDDDNRDLALGDMGEAIAEGERPRAPSPLDRVCDVCGCDGCECTAWVDVNTNELSASEGPTDQCWCPTCETHDTTLIDRAEFEAAQKVAERVAS